MIDWTFALLGLLGGIGDDPSPGPTDLAAEEPAPAPAPEYALRIAPVFRWLTGHTKVREDLVEGTKLDLNRDLGLGPAYGGNAQFEIESSAIQFLAEVEEVFAS